MVKRYKYFYVIFQTKNYYDYLIAMVVSQGYICKRLLAGRKSVSAVSRQQAPRKSLRDVVRLTKVGGKQGEEVPGHDEFGKPIDPRFVITRVVQAGNFEILKKAKNAQK